MTCIIAKFFAFSVLCADNNNWHRFSFVCKIKSTKKFESIQVYPSGSPNFALLRNIVECHHKYKKIQFEDYQEKFVEPLSSGKTFPEHSEILAPTKINLPQYSMKLPTMQGVFKYKMI